MATATTTEEPFPISYIAGRYLLYSAEIVSHIRQYHNTVGVLIGSLPQAPQQNVFLGLPLELVPEEARLLCEKGVAYIVDDARAHKRAFMEHGLSAEEKKVFREMLRRQGVGAAKEAVRRTGERKKAAIAKKIEKSGGSWNDIPEDMLRPASPRRGATNDRKQDLSEDAEAKDEPFFSTSTSAIPISTMSQTHSDGSEPYAVTPTTSNPPIALPTPPPSPAGSADLPVVSRSTYPLYAHLHNQGYFLHPGLRFGCNYMAYPGDPLRFHSHFLCKGLEWEQEFDLLELVGGGRLGTGVKKGFLMGGRREAEREGGVGLRRTSSADDLSGLLQDDGDGGGGDVRCFCIEWAGM